MKKFDFDIFNKKFIWELTQWVSQNWFLFKKNDDNLFEKAGILIWKYKPRNY